MNSRTESDLIASPMQSSMLMPVLRGDAVQPYVQQFRWTFLKEVDWQTLEKAWLTVFKRHDVFYHRFHLSRQGEITVTRSKNIQVSFSYEIWSRLSGEKQKKRLNEFLKQDLEAGFPSASEPLCRLKLIRLNAQLHELILTSHHALFDGRSRLILLQEFLAVYHAYREGNIAQLPVAPGFSDYLKWIQKKSWKKSKTFWNQKLADIQEATANEIGFGSKPPKSATGFTTFSGNFLDKKNTAKVHLWSEKNELSINVLVQAAWAIYLNRTSGEDEVIFAAPRACRKSVNSKAERTVGLFLNTVPVVTRFRKRETIHHYLNRIRENWFELRQHEHTPYRIIKNCSQMAPDKPLFTSMAGYESYELNQLINSNHSFRFSLNGFTDLPFVLQVKGGKTLGIEIIYDKSEFSASTIQQMLSIYRSIFLQLAGSGKQLVENIELLSKSDKKRILKFGTGKRPDCGTKPVHQVFEGEVEKSPSKIALRWKPFRSPTKISINKPIS